MEIDEKFECENIFKTEDEKERKDIFNQLIAHMIMHKLESTNEQIAHFSQP